MNWLVQFRLRIIIPVIVCIIFVIVSSFFVLKQINDARKLTITSLSTLLENQMYRLQCTINDLLNQNLSEIAIRRMAEFSLDPKIKILVLADEKGIIRIANNAEYIGDSITKIPEYSPSIAYQIIKNTSGKLILSKNHSYSAYYSIDLGLVKGELRLERIGILFMYYDFSPLMQVAKSNAIKEILLFDFVGLIFAGLLSFILYCLITRRVIKINMALNNFANGRFNTRIGLFGKDEIGKIAEHFDIMAQQIEQESSSLQLMQFILDHSSDAVFIIKPDSSFYYVNESAAMGLGYSLEELLNLNIPSIDICFNNETWQKHWAELKVKKHISMESIHLTKEGIKQPVEIRANYLKFKNL